ncbi:MAG: DUF2235 domain-containing protein [Pseudomonadota bacterium]
MAVIAIFCDGTWNRYDGNGQTHVARLAEACVRDASQNVLYFEGVGTGTGMVSDLGRWISKMGGGLFGWGLNDTIKAAYLAVCKIYQPGDRIMIFGFSRGAYTARSLVGMIRKCGILADTSQEQLDQAFRLYRRRGRGNSPDAPGTLKARRVLSPYFATSQSDVVYRGDDSFLVRITYLGVWDTVGALGIPRSLLGRLATRWNARYAFHDTSLSRLVEKARHAVALDEKRVFFEPTLWDNLEPKGADPGLNRGDQSNERYYQQLWFPGNHGIVGGSTPPEELAAASLGWIWAGARDAGLRLAPGRQIPTVVVDAIGPAPALYDVNRLYRFVPWLLRWRRGPAVSHELHPTARLRAAVISTYRPLSLRRVLPRFFQPR